MKKKTLKGLIIAGVITGVGAVVVCTAKKVKEAIELKTGVNINEDNDKENREECEDLFSKIRAERGWNEENDLEQSESCGEECSHCCGCHECTCHDEDEYDEEEDDEEEDDDDEEEEDNAKYQLQRCKGNMKRALNNSYDIEDLKGYLRNVFSDLTYTENDLDEEDAETYRKLKSIKEQADEFINIMEEKDLSTLDDLRNSEENEELLNKIIILIDKVENL